MTQSPNNSLEEQTDTKQILQTLLERIEGMDEVAHLETADGTKVDASEFKLIFKGQVSTLITNQLKEL